MVLPTIKYLIKADGYFVVAIDYENIIYKYNINNKKGEFNTKIKAIQTGSEKSKVFIFQGFDEYNYFKKLKKAIKELGYNEVAIIRV